MKGMFLFEDKDKCFKLKIRSNDLTDHFNQILNHLSKNDKRINYFSLEMKDICIESINMIFKDFDSVDHNPYSKFMNFLSFLVKHKKYSCKNEQEKSFIEDADYIKKNSIFLP